MVFSNPQYEINYETHKHFEKYILQEKGRRLTAKWRLDQVSKHIKPSRLLEIGCSGGLFLDEARKKGWDVTGTEISIPAVKYARESLNLNIYDSDDLSQLKFNNKFNVIVLFDILEHLDSPTHFIKYITDNLLESDGLIVIEVPNIFTFYSKLMNFLSIPNSHLMFQHYYYFSKQTIRLLVNSCKLNIINMKYGRRIYPLDYCFDRLLKRNVSIQKTIVSILTKIKLDHIYINAGLHEFFFFICKNNSVTNK